LPEANAKELGGAVYILYLDESGVPELNAGTSHFVLLGIAVRMDQWKTIDANIEREKSAFDLQDIEIHAGWMARRYSEQESVPNFEALSRSERRIATTSAIKKRAGVLGVSGAAKKMKSYRLESRKITPYIHLTRAERKQCLEATANELAGWSEVRIFADAISKSDFTLGRYSPYEMAFEQIVSRFQTFLAKQGSLGLIVSDNNATAAPRLTALSRKFHKDGTLYKDIVNIVETPLFVDSGLTSMIQMADLCSYALRRFIENNEQALWRIVEPRVDQLNGALVGVRHYTAKRQCTCPICVAHGRKAAI
jgi:hypothetical protein